MGNFQRGLCLVFVINICFLNAWELSNKYESLSHIYKTYDEGPGLHHYFTYGPVYDENINQIREKAVMLGTKVKMLEIGVQSGGSTRVWKRYFRSTLQYVGIDINRSCKIYESPDEGIAIEIGSQMNTTFLSKICSTYGPFDLVVDDGGHTNEMIMTSLLTLWSCLNDNAVYVIEDLHALSMGRKYIQPKDINVFERIAQWMKIRSPAPLPRHDHDESWMTNHPGWHLKKLSFYDSMLFLYYGKDVPALDNFLKGTKWLDFGEGTFPKDTDKRCPGCCVKCYDD